MKKIPHSTWLLWLGLGLLSCLIWLQLTYSRFSFIRLSINKNEALQIAEDYLAHVRGVDPSLYREAVIFAQDVAADRYMQKTIGFEGEKDFILQHNFDLFFWKTRFFRENEIEEYRVTISAQSGKVIAFAHIIPDAAARPSVGEATAKGKAMDFLRQNFAINLDEYSLHANLTTTRDHRQDYSFVWRKNNVYIPWKTGEHKEGAKLLLTAKVSGDEILSFSKEDLDIPQEFSRFIAKQKQTGRNLSPLFGILYTALLILAIFIVLVSRYHLIMHTTKKFYINLVLALVILYLVNTFSEYQSLLFSYPTTSTMKSYLWQAAMGLFMQIFIITVTVLMPCLAGEALSYELYPQEKERGFLQYIRTTFLSRSAAQRIFLGYGVACVLLGIQAMSFELGYRYWGVWREHPWMIQLSSSGIPSLATFIGAFHASIQEETSFRLFGIHAGRKILKNMFLGVLLSALVWGYGHGHYEIFPMWFRGLEVTLLGLFLSWVYLRYGIICVVVAHYLFNAFWGSAGHLLNKSDSLYFYSALGIVLLPLAFGLLAFVKNKSLQEGGLRWNLNKHQLFNTQILKAFLLSTNNQGESSEDIRKELISHHWDMAVVDTVLEELGERKEKI